LKSNLTPELSIKKRKMKHKSNIVIIDNYDSFTYNLIKYIEDIAQDPIDVFMNDEIVVDELEHYEYIFISPGPGLPNESGITLELIDRYLKSKKIFGVCLGLQALVESMGGQLKNLDRVYHGIETLMIQSQSNRSPIFESIPEQFIAGRYHSWVADKENFPDDLVITCEDEEGQIMAIQHKEFPVYAVQFHPESIMTPRGKTMIENFLKL